MKNHTNCLFMDPLVKKGAACSTACLTCVLFYFCPESVLEKDKKTDGLWVCACLHVRVRGSWRG